LTAINVHRGLEYKVGGTPVARSVWRVAFWGTPTMGITAGVGTLFGAPA
jgi:hypothetical protein